MSAKKEGGYRWRGIFDALLQSRLLAARRRLAMRGYDGAAAGLDVELRRCFPPALAEVIELPCASVAFPPPDSGVDIPDQPPLAA